MFLAVVLCLNAGTRAVAGGSQLWAVVAELRRAGGMEAAPPASPLPTAHAAVSRLPPCTGQGLGAQPFPVEESSC